MIADIFRGGKNAGPMVRFERRFVGEDGQVIYYEPTEPVAKGVTTKAMIARQRALYAQVAAFCRPDSRVLDCPCGVGNGAMCLNPLGVNYCGLDEDAVAVQYARQVYGWTDNIKFGVRSMCQPGLEAGEYNVIACIDPVATGDPDALLRSFRDALTSGGVLVVSVVEKGVEGPQGLDNLTGEEFSSILLKHFGREHLILTTQPPFPSAGINASCMTGICFKP